MNKPIAEIFAFHAKNNCQWCGGTTKKECVTVSFKAGLLDKSIVCTKCLRNALRVNALQPPVGQQSANKVSSGQPAVSKPQVAATPHSSQSTASERVGSASN
jgi:hypothetical protein